MRSALALSVFLPLPLSQDKTVITVAWPKDAVVDCEAIETRRATIEVEKLEGTVKMERVAKTTRRFTDTVLAEKDGRPTKVERRFAAFTREDVEGARLRDTPLKTPLDGKTIVMMRKGDETVYEGADDIDARELGAEHLRPDPLLASLPAAAVGVGDTWKVDEKSYLAELNKRTTTKWTKAEITATLTKIDKGSATIWYRLKLSGTTDRGESASFMADARHIIDPARKRLLYFAMESSYTVEADKHRVCLGSLVSTTQWTWKEK